ncbi:MAG TPA: hypothetical protein PKA55_00820 [Rhodoblastus sp.]|nr:hypothetical protein [Rhodoblastus sp.]
MTPSDASADVVRRAFSSTAGPVRIFKQTGNSTSIGCQSVTGGEVVHRDTPADVLGYGFMFNPGAISSGARGIGAARLRPDTLRDFVPIYEQNFPGKSPGESHGTSMLSWLAWRRAHLALPQELMLYRAHGAAGKSLREISKGTQPYENGLVELRRATEIAAGYGKRVVCEDCIISNGTQERKAGVGRSQFVRELEEIARDHKVDWSQITGQTEDIRTWITQLSANFTPARAIGSEISLAQLDFVRSNKLARMVGPRYPFQYADVSHFVAERGYIWEGEYIAKAIFQEIQGVPWKALGQDILIRRDGRNVFVHFDRGGLTIDKTTLPPAPQLGFAVHEGDAQICIEDVLVFGERQKDDSVRLALEREPEGDDLWLSYSFDGPGSRLRSEAGCPGPAAWGNLRDCDPTPSRYFRGESLPNWCVVMKERIHRQ